MCQLSFYDDLIHVAIIWTNMQNCVCVNRQVGVEVQTGQQQTCRDPEQHSEEPRQRTAPCCFHQQAGRHRLYAGDTGGHVFPRFHPASALGLVEAFLEVTRRLQQNMVQECHWKLRKTLKQTSR